MTDYEKECRTSSLWKEDGSILGLQSNKITISVSSVNVNIISEN